MNKYFKTFLFVIFSGILTSSCTSREHKKSKIKVDTTGYYSEQYRPQFHFSPEANWMNDPNGLVFPTEKFTKLILFSKGGNVLLSEAEFHGIEKIWP